MLTEQTTPGESHPRRGAGGAAPVTEELARRVADEVYQLFLRDLKRERELRGGSGQTARSRTARSPGAMSRQWR